MIKKDSKKAVILFSGGLDSTTCLAIAKSEGFDCYALSFDYGQRHIAEVKNAEYLAKEMGVIEHRIVRLSIGELGGSALTDKTQAIPAYTQQSSKIPSTYVPARNTIFLSIALGWAETVDAQAIFIGANAVDYSNYADCRPEFIDAFEKVAQLATKAGIEDNKFFKIHAPLLSLSKAEIIQTGMQLGIDYKKTASCYELTDDYLACGACDSCGFRRKGFEEAGVPDPTRYINYVLTN
jgi:7-cyano-7-deazaguanine synthase